jgi:hypothetical protein
MLTIRRLLLILLEKVLTWFVESQMSPNDLVAISDTEVNIGVLDLK